MFYRGIPNFRTLLPAASVVSIFMLICMWRIFTKAGEKGWKCLIPLYSLYVFCQIAWDKSKFWEFFICSTIISLLNFFLGFTVITVSFSLVMSIYFVYVFINMSIILSHRFNKSTAFGILGLLIFSIIGFPILAFGSADYDVHRAPSSSVGQTDNSTDSDISGSPE